MFKGLQKWRKGESAIGFAIASVLMTFLLLLAVGCVMLYNSYQVMDQAAMRVSRDLVVCTSMKEAKKTAQKEIKEALKDQWAISKPTAEVRYTFVRTGKAKKKHHTSSNSKDSEWQRGQFITLTVRAYFKSTTPFTSGYRSTDVTVMVERNKEITKNSGKDAEG